MDRRPTRRGIDPEPLAQRDLELQGHHVEPRHHLRHRVLDLQPCVHLQEVERAVLVDDAFDRAGVHVAGRERERFRRLAEPVAEGIVEHR